MRHNDYTIVSTTALPQSVFLNVISENLILLKIGTIDLALSLVLICDSIHRDRLLIIRTGFVNLKIFSP